MMKRYDVCIIGAGPAGYKAAMLLAKNGKSVCLIEKEEKKIGGTCLNEGCIPAKNYIETAVIKDKIAHFKNRGLLGDVEGIDLSLLKRQTISLLDGLRGGLYKKLSGLGISFEFGDARFVSDRVVEIELTSKRIEASNFIIATGSLSKEHPLLKVDGKFILSSKEMFELEEIPEDMLIVGGGAIGCEFASFFNSCGTKVHLVEFLDEILPSEDKDVSSTIKREYKKRGIKVDTSTTAISYDIKEGKVEVTLEDRAKKRSVFTYDKVLCAIGRVPNTSGIMIEKAGIKRDKRGYIEVDSDLRSSNPLVFAIGDAINTPALAHQAYYEAKKVCSVILKRDDIRESVTPNVIFTSPQIGSVGKSEKELKDKGIEYRAHKLYMKSLGMPKIKGDDSGFVKLLIGNDDKILGASIVGYDATEVVNQIAICIDNSLSIEEINSMIIAHPTMSESFLKLIEAI